MISYHAMSIVHSKLKLTGRNLTILPHFTKLRQLRMSNSAGNAHAVSSVGNYQKQSATSSLPGGHLVVHVKGKVNSNDIPSFYKQTINNAKNSILESGIVRFDVLRNIDNIEDFLLIEIYKDDNQVNEHKLTTHYRDWKETVETMMVAPRASVKYTTLYPKKVTTYFTLHQLLQFVEIDVL